MRLSSIAPDGEDHEWTRYKPQRRRSSSHKRKQVSESLGGDAALPTSAHRKPRVVSMVATDLEPFAYAATSQAGSVYLEDYNFSSSPSLAYPEQYLVPYDLERGVEVDPSSAPEHALLPKSPSHVETDFAIGNSNAELADAGSAALMDIFLLPNNICLERYDNCFACNKACSPTKFKIANMSICFICYNSVASAPLATPFCPGDISTLST